MPKNRFIHEALSSPWFIAPDQAVHYHAQLVKLLGNDNAFEDREVGEPKIKNLPFLAVMTEKGMYDVKGRSSDFSSAPKGSVAVIPVDGPMMKNDNCGDAGTVTMSQWINDAAANPNISGIIISFDSPGGTVSGTESFSNSVIAARAVKPVLAFANDGMICSAAYWVAAHADEIMAGSKTSVIGSIGVFTTLSDYTAMYEKFGVKVEDIYSSLSSEKNADYRAWLEGNKQPTINRLDQIAGQFHSAVKAQRGNKISTKGSDPYKGSTYLAPDALNNGLIDSIGSFQDAMVRITELSNSKQNSNTSAMKKFNLPVGLKSLVAFFKQEPAAGQTDIEIDVAQLATLNAHLDSLTAQASASVTEIAGLKEQVTALATERDTLRATIATYGNLPGATGSNPIQSKTDDIDQGKKIDVFNFDHEKEADALLG